MEEEGVLPELSQRWSVPTHTNHHKDTAAGSFAITTIPRQMKCKKMYICANKLVRKSIGICIVTSLTFKVEPVWQYIEK